MELDLQLLLHILILLILAGIALYVLLELVRQQLHLRAQHQQQVLRLQSLQQQVSLVSQQASHDENKARYAWSGTRKFKVDQIVQETPDVRSFYLAAHDGKPLPSYEAGQYLTFQLDIAGKQRKVTRCYSLSDTALQDDRYRVTVKRIGPPAEQPELPAGASSSYFHDTLSLGDILNCKSPRGNFHLDMNQQSPVVLIAGGIGITPMISMLRSIALSGSKREVWLFYGVRNASELVQAKQLQELADQNKNIHLQFCFSEPLPSERLDYDYHHAEWVSVELMRRILPSANYDYFICGPAAMMTAITTDLSSAGVPAERVHYESFGPASVKPKAAKKLAPEAAAVTHIVNFARTGKRLEWQAECGPLLDFAQANGIDLDCGCRAGSCGSCMIAVRQGSIEYIDEISAEPEPGSCLACMAIPTGELTIDA